MTPVRTTRREALRYLSLAVVGSAIAVSTGVASAGPDRASTPSVIPEADPVLADLGEPIQQLMREYAVPGVGIGLRLAGNEHSTGFGVTNVEFPRPVDGGTVFQVGSITKTFTGTAAAMLAERGLLDLDAPARRYVPELTLADPEAANQITLRHLASH